VSTLHVIVGYRTIFVDCSAVKCGKQRNDSNDDDDDEDDNNNASDSTPPQTWLSSNNHVDDPEQCQTGTITSLVAPAADQLKLSAEEYRKQVR